MTKETADEGNDIGRGEEPNNASRQRDWQWIGPSILWLGLGSMGPANAYLAFTDPHYFDKLSGWRLFLLPVGAWMLTGMLVMGLAGVWSGGVMGKSDWSRVRTR